MQTVTPYLLYEDVAAAIDWLSRAFGFEERLHFADDDGTVTHAEVALGDGVVYLGHPGAEYRSPKRVGTSSHLVHVYVKDVDAHHARAVEAGVPVLGELEDTPYGDRRYDAEDLEGQRWSFAQRMKAVAPEDWGATAA
jgi:PhnB protein